jgi:hypothetical protein
MSAWDRAEDAADIPWWQKALVAVGYAAPPIGASLLATWLIAKAGGWHWSQVLNSFYAYMAVTIVIGVFGKRVLPERTADLLTALSLGLWLGAMDGFWKGAAFFATMSAALVAMTFLAEVATRLWRLWRARSARR